MVLQNVVVPGMQLAMQKMGSIRKKSAKFRAGDGGGVVLHHEKGKGHV